MLRELGRGATSVVYLARDSVIGRQVALKTFPAEFVEQQQEPEQFRRRLLREAESAGRLSHANIVTVHDVAVGSSVEPAYIALEYVEGETLKDRLRRGQRLPTMRVVDLMAQIAAGLDYAHAHGVVHRDVKPANILITPDGRAKITDFGVAHLITSDLTLEGEVLGTPSYMPPEQVQGRPLDHRADVFAAGVVACEMLAGRSPLAGGALAAVVHDLVQGKLDLSPSGLALPLPVCRVLARAMARDPELRYQSAGEFAADLREAEAEVRGSDTGDTRVLWPSPLRWRALLPPGLRAELGLGLSRLAARRTLRRGGLVAAAALSLLAVAGLALWPRTADDGEAGLAQARLHYLQLLREGHRLLGEGEPVAALRRLERAEQLAPGSPGARRLREQALDAVRQGEAAARLEEVKGALRAGRYEEAMAASEALLRLSPSAAATRALLAELETALSRRAPAGAVASLSVPPAPASAAEPAPAWSVLRVELESELREGALLVYAGESRLLELDLSAGPAPFVAGDHLLAAGDNLLRLYLTPPGRPARMTTVTATLPAGGARTLAVRVSAAGEISARLL